MWRLAMLQIIPAFFSKARSYCSRISCDEVSSAPLAILPAMADGIIHAIANIVRRLIIDREEDPGCKRKLHSTFNNLQNLAAATALPI
jgi:hypothetical protein